MNKKGFLQISFAWLFAIIVGAFILFLAIYAVTKIINTEEKVQTAKTSQEIGILLNPLETGFEDVRSTSISFPTETRIYNKCDVYGNFGKQRIQIEQKSFNKWVKTDIEATFQNKYIFSEIYSEGKTFYLFSKPFEFPFKVTDLIIITSASEEYCFVNPPEDIEDEISAIKQENLFLENCSSSSISVCFDRTNCDVNIDYDTGSGSVEKNGKKMYFETDALMYAAIFSDEKTYECQVQRIMKRVEQLATIYIDKGIFMRARGCDSDLVSRLNLLRNSASNLKDSAELYLVNNIAEELGKGNGGRCNLW